MCLPLVPPHHLPPSDYPRLRFDHYSWLYVQVLYCIVLRVLFTTSSQDFTDNSVMLYNYQCACNNILLLWKLWCVSELIFFWIQELLSATVDVSTLRVLCRYTTIFCCCWVHCNCSCHCCSFCAVKCWFWSLHFPVCVTQSPELPAGSETFPLDWSLKTKVRFVTSSSLSWCGLIRGSEESCGSEAFTACSPLATASQLQVLITSDGPTGWFLFK